MENRVCLVARRSPLSRLSPVSVQCFYSRGISVEKLPLIDEMLYRSVFPRSFEVFSALFSFSYFCDSNCLLYLFCFRDVVSIMLVNCMVPY